MSEQKLKRKPQELILAKRLIDECKYDEADQLIKNFEEKGGHTLYDTVLCHLLNCELLLSQGLYKDVVKLAEQTYKESLGLGKNFLSVDILLIMANAQIWFFQSDKLHDIIKQGEELLKTLTHELPTEYKQREAYIAFLKGWFYITIKDADQAIKQFELSISWREELGAKAEIAFSLVGISFVFIELKGNYDGALKYSERGMTVAEESGNKYCIGYCLKNMAIVYSLKGELDRSIMLYEQSLTIFNDLNNKDMVSSILNPLGSTYRMRGKFDRALECIEQAMAINRDIGRLRAQAVGYINLIQILIDKGDHERAQQYLHDLEELNNQLKNKKFNFWYLYEKALLLKKSPRTRNWAKAEEIFRQILEEVDLDYELIIQTLLSLCELLLIELRITNDSEVLDELNQFITRLLDLSNKSHSFWVLGETYLLQAKLSLISLNLEGARKLLTQGQEIAEKYGLDLLAKKISNEHDELLKQLEMWEKLKETKAPLAERMKLSRLNEQMDNMLRKRAVEPEEIKEEESVVILIISTGGTPIFSQSFAEGWAFQDHLFGGFLSAINSFSGEIFSQGLDRAIFGEYTILMNAVSPFIVCYLFKGQSFLAQKRMKKFITTLQTEKKIWEPIEKYYKAHQLIQEADIPSLDLLVNETFIERES
ncbi:MAG: tetratricopeptide repeat protein [Promethearchaeota archaeon]